MDILKSANLTMPYKMIEYSCQSPNWRRELEQELLEWHQVGYEAISMTYANTAILVLLKLRFPLLP
jgi:hypothetical protein